MTDPDSRNRVIVVDDEMRSYQAKALKILGQMQGATLFLPALRELKVRDWQDREKRLTRPKRTKSHKRGRT